MAAFGVDVPTHPSANIFSHSGPENLRLPAAHERNLENMRSGQSEGYLAVAGIAESCGCSQHLEIFVRNVEQYPICIVCIV